MKQFLLILLLAVLTGSFFAACSKDDDTPSAKTFVLVHGSFQGPYAWDYVKPLLEAKGQKVVVVELPGHGNDNTPPANTSINVYRDKVIAAINGVGDKVILVGHSMGGMVISATAEQIPDRIEKLVYIAGFVPKSGQSLLELAQHDAQSLLGPALEPSADMLTLNVATDKLFNIFCQDGTDVIKQLLIAKYRAEPAPPFPNKVTVTGAAFGKVEKCYIRTLQDHTVGIDLQDEMLAAAGITKTYTLNTSHCPFLSKPDVLTDMLLDIIK